MKTEDLIPDEFFKQFKTGEELNDFLKSIPKTWYREDAGRRARCSFLW